MLHPITCILCGCIVFILIRRLGGDLIAHLGVSAIAIIILFGGSIHFITPPEMWQNKSGENNWKELIAFGYKDLIVSLFFVFLITTLWIKEMISKKEPRKIRYDDYYITYDKKISDMLVRLKLFFDEHGNLRIPKFKHKIIHDENDGSKRLELYLKEEILDVDWNTTKKVNDLITKLTKIQSDIGDVILDTIFYNPHLRDYVHLNCVSFKKRYRERDGLSFCYFDSYNHTEAYD